MTETLKVFVGCAPNGDDAESMMVLEHALRTRCSLPVHITWMRLSGDVKSPFYSQGTHGWQTRLWATPFSGFRWALPELCGFEGRAIYTDSDVIPLRDWAELWRTPMYPNKVVLAKGTGVDGWRFCVSLWDCAAAEPHMPPGKVLRAQDGHARMRKRFAGSAMVQSFGDVDWNVIDGEDYDRLDDPRIGSIHYSSEAHQPHLRLAVPRMRASSMEHWFVAGGGKVQQHWRKDVRDLFDVEYARAVEAGYTADRYTPARAFGKVHMASRKNYGSNHWAQQYANR